MSRHLITGGAGFLGSALAKRLLAEGHEVTVLDRFSRGKRWRLPETIRTIESDIREGDDPQALNGFATADVIWHLAYVQGTQTFYADPKDVIDVALHGIMNVLAACERDPGKELILVSSSEVYQDPPAGMYPTDETVPLSVPDVTNPRYSYGGGKIASELATLAYAQAGVLKRAVIVRPHNIYGPDMGNEHVIPELANQVILKSAIFNKFELKIQGSGEETRSFCYINDAIDGLMVLLDRGEDRNVYHLGNPYEEHTIRDVAQLIGDWFGADMRIIPGELPKGSPIRRLPDIGKMRALGYKPRWTLLDGLAHTLPFYAEQAKAVAS